MINREQLLNVLSELKPGLSSNEIISQMGHFIFDKNTITTYNDCVSVTRNFDTGLQCSIDASDFMSLIERLKGDELELKQDKDNLILTSGKTKAIFKTSTENFIEDRIDILKSYCEEIVYKEISPFFIEGIELCYFSTASRAGKEYLTTILIDGKSIIATDDYRVSWYEMPDFIWEGKIIIPSSYVKDMDG